MKTVIVFFADGFEECEGLLVVDLLRRAGIRVVTASIMGRKEITSSHGIVLQADALAEEVDYAEADMIVLPGGLPGTNYLGDSEIVQEQCRAFARNKTVAAICAAPSVLASLQLLDGRRAACHPAFEEKMNGAVVTGGSVEVADNIITGQGLGAGIPFALQLVETLAGPEEAERIAGAICFRRN